MQGQCTGNQATFVATYTVPKISPFGALVGQTVSKKCPGLDADPNAKAKLKAKVRGKGGLLVDAFLFGRSDIVEDAEKVPLVEELEWIRVDPYEFDERPDGCRALLNDPVLTKVRKPVRRNDGYIIELGK